MILAPCWSRHLLDISMSISFYLFMSSVTFELIFAYFNCVVCQLYLCLLLEAISFLSFKIRRTSLSFKIRRTSFSAKIRRTSFSYTNKRNFFFFQDKSNFVFFENNFLVLLFLFENFEIPKNGFQNMKGSTTHEILHSG